MIDCRNIDPGEWRGFSRKKGDTLLMAGFPCPSFSGAGNRLGTDDPRGQLLHNAVALHNKLCPDWFLYENVASMKQEHKDMISKLIGVEPIEINSNLVSAQNRARLYWTNIPYHGPPQDRGVLLKHILEDGYVDRDKSHCIDANYFKGGNLRSYFEKHRRQLVFSKDGLCHIGDADLNGHGYLKRVYHQEGKAPTLTTNGGGNREPKVYVEPMEYRKLTPLECERLQTLPDNYTKKFAVSNTQRYKMIGNGYTVDVIAHILSGIPDDTTIQRVYSLFDGCSMGQVALHRAMYSLGKQDLLAPDYRYFSSEIDKWAMKVTQANWNATVQMGDIKDLSLYKIIKERWY